MVVVDIRGFVLGAITASWCAACLTRLGELARGEGTSAGETGDGCTPGKRCRVISDMTTPPLALLKRAIKLT